MNTIARQLTRLTLIAVALAGGITTQVAHAADKAPRGVQLQPVVVVGKRVRVIELELVVVIAKRQAPATMVVAQRAARAMRG